MREVCDVWELARRGDTVQGEMAQADLPRLAGLLADDSGTLRFRLDGFIDALRRPAATLQLDGVVRLRCDRCGAIMDVPIGERAQFHFVASEEELGRLPIDAEAEEPLLGSPQFDLAALVEDQAILALPMSPRHSSCGQAPGEPEAAEAPEAGETHRPFERLATLRKPKQ